MIKAGSFANLYATIDEVSLIQDSNGLELLVGGEFKDNGSTDSWAEICLVRNEPQDGVDVLSTPVVPQLDFEQAPLQEIEALFQLFSTMEYDIHEGVKNALLSATPVNPFD